MSLSHGMEDDRRDYRRGIDLGTRVKHEGRDLGFTVGDMLPAKRWAVDAQGNTVPRLEFIQGFQQRWMVNAKNEEAQLVPVPNQVEYVSWTVNDEGRAVPIGWSIEDDGYATPAVRAPVQMLTQAEAEARDRRSDLDVQVNLISSLVRDGTLSAEQGMRKIMELTSAGAGPELAPEPEPAPEPEIAVEPATLPPDAEAISTTAKLLSLSPREAEVYQAVDPKDPRSANEQTKEIAERLGITHAAARSYYYNARAKVEG